MPSERRAELIKYLEFIRECHRKNGIPPRWEYDGPADVLIREGSWFDSAEAVHWEDAEPRACFRNAALYAISHPGVRYFEGYAYGSILAVHHGWCVDADNKVIELTWKKPGLLYFGIEFSPMWVMKGSVLFNRDAICRYKLKKHVELKATK